MGKLTVQLDKVTNLIDRDLFGKSDPFVEFHLETDNFGPFDNSHGKKKSTIIKDCVDPVYNETFVWENVPHLKNLTLWCKVMDHDPIKNDKLGSCKIKIDELPFEGNKFVSCDRVVDRNLLKANGRIYLHIKWEQ